MFIVSPIPWEEGGIGTEEAEGAWDSGGDAGVLSSTLVSGLADVAQLGLVVSLLVSVTLGLVLGGILKNASVYVPMDDETYRSLLWSSLRFFPIGDSCQLDDEGYIVS